MAIDVGQVRARLSAKEGGPAGDFAAYVDDPVGFAVHVLGIEPWSRQREILRSVVEHDQVAVRSGHKVSKSLSAAILALWFASTRAGGRVILTAPTSRQVRGVLWREIRALHRRAIIPLGGIVNELPENGIIWPDGRSIEGFSTDESERFAGISGVNLFFIVDEASGVGEPIFEAISGCRAGGGLLLVISNASRTSGTLYEAFNGKADFWHKIHISSLESPNVTGERWIPGLATKKWCDEKREEYGEGSPFYQVRVLGDFPTQAENAVIGLGLVEAATARWSPGLCQGESFRDAGRLELGVDPARFGSDTAAVVARRGYVAMEPVCFRGLDTVALAGKVLEVARGLRRTSEIPLIRVDSIGIGAGVVDHLAQHDDVEVIAVNVAESATTGQHARLRDEVWFRTRDWLRDGGCIPPDQKLVGELVAPTYSFDVSGKLKVEAKDETKKRLKRSPDRADALCLAVYDKARELTTAELWMQARFDDDDEGGDIRAGFANFAEG